MKEFLNWWQYIPYYINPVAFKIGSFQVYYYGLMYLIAFFITYLLMLYRLKTEDIKIKKEDINNCFIWLMLAVLVGGRLGYVLFYDLAYYLRRPLEIFLPFEINDGFRYTGLYGMSYHGALIAVVIIAMIVLRKHKLDFWKFSDLLVSAIPLGYAFGRLGNFINGELYGRITTVPWGMYFPLDQMHRLRHPSQLYEALLEGAALFVILWSLRKRMKISGALFSLYLIGYGATRFFIEFFRQPDPQLGLILGPFSMGQILCLAMFLFGLVIFGIRILIVK